MSFPSRAAVWCSIGFSTLALAAVSSAPADAAVMNFNGRAHGEIVDDYYVASKGVRISAANFQGGPDLAIAFDTRKTSTNDLDLEDPWTKGNIAGGVDLQKILILAENDVDHDRNGRIDRPDDQGSQPHLGSSGQITFEFAGLQQSFGLDLIDVEGGDYTEPSLPPALLGLPVGDQVGFIAFYLRGVEVRRVSLAEFVTPTSPFYDPTVVYGDRSANRIQPMDASDLNILAFDKIVMDMGMCYGIDNLQFEAFDGAQVPEPSGMALMGLGVALLARRVRRK